MRRNKPRIRRKNNGIRKLILLLILVFIIIQIFRVIIPASVTFSRYVYSVVRSYYLNSKKFYFNSDKLAEHNATFEANNWSGVDEYKITINMDSKYNGIESSATDIEYKVSYNFDVYQKNGKKYDNPEELIDFQISKAVSDDGYIYSTIYKAANNKDYFDITIKPRENIKLMDDDYVYISVKAEATSPYKKTLSGEFKIYVGNLGMSYRIEDKPYNPYLEVIVTNTLDYYIVDTAFGGHEAGSHITIADYNKLTDAEKSNCHSMNITMDFDPNNVVMDTTSGIYMIASENNDVTTTDKNSYTYINSITFNMDAEESKVIKFYKIEASKDYTYPFGDTDPVVNVRYS